MFRLEDVIFHVLMSSLIFLFSPVLLLSHMREVLRPRSDLELRHSMRALRVLVPAALAWIYMIFLAVR